jgi:hypothetical protein
MAKALIEGDRISILTDQQILILGKHATQYIDKGIDVPEVIAKAIDLLERGSSLEADLQIIAFSLFNPDELPEDQKLHPLVLKRLNNAILINCPPVT